MCFIIKIRHHEVTRFINYETARPSSPSINISSQACLSYQMSNLPREHSFFWALCVDRSLKKGCWSCGGGWAAPPPPKSPGLVCSVKWHKPATSSEASPAALQPVEREAHLFIFCSSGRGLHSWSCKGHRTGPPLVITVPCDPPGGKSESICSLSPIQQGMCNLRGRVYINSDLNICMHMPHL